MAELSASVRLRPTRIGFLVRPNDMRSVKRIMRVSACLWGGEFNPIIPVFRRAPREWQPEQFERIRGLDIGKGYVRFFEPDVFVEATKGLFEDVGMVGRDEFSSRHPIVVTLNEFLRKYDDDGREWSEPIMGLSVSDVYRHQYSTTQRFKPRQENLALIVRPDSRSGLVEGMFGAFPTARHANYFEINYRDVFEPSTVAATPDTWRQVHRDGAVTPLRAGRYKIERTRYWYHDLVLFVFDPTRPTDLIDLWNMRIGPNPVIPVPVSWVEELSDDLQDIIKGEHRPIRDNPSGLMHRTTVEFGRSLPDSRREAVTDLVTPGLPNDALMFKHWRSSIWIEQTDDRIQADERIQISTQERRIRLTTQDDDHLYASFDNLYPEFASRGGLTDFRWVNVLNMSSFHEDGVATVLPHNTFDRRWPRLGLGSNQVVVGTEGWAFGQRYREWNEGVEFLKSGDAIVESLSKFGIVAKQSDPGRVAQQMLESLGGLRGVNLLADLGTIQLLNKMAGSVRRQSNEAETIEEYFDSRSAPIKDWIDLIARRKELRRLPQIELKHFTRRNVIRLGLETRCPNCQFKNWHGLTESDYSLECERCLKHYPFPQAALREHNRNWRYRVIGPFSVPDYGRGAYSSLLSLRVLDCIGSSDDEITYSTAMNFQISGESAEADFVAWHQKGRFDRNDQPRLIIGESKSLGSGDLIKPKDLQQLRKIARCLPSAVIVIAVLRDHFTDAEKRRLMPFVKWCRRMDKLGRQTNPVVLLTSKELFVEHYVSWTWESLGEPHSKFADYRHTRNLDAFAEATQQIYLGLPPVHEEWQESRLRRRR